MAHESLKLIPGVDQNRTPALNEAAISESNLIRFVSDRQGIALPQKLGGWVTYGSNWPLSSSSIRAMHAWSDTEGVNRLAMGAEGALMIGSPSIQPTDITPQFSTADLAVNFSTTAGSSTVTVTDDGSNATLYESIFINTHISVGGLILFGSYQCRPGTANSYFITATDILGNAVAAASTASPGAVAQFSTTTGSLNVVVTLNNHGFSVGSTYPVLVSTTVGGIDLYGNYIVQTVTSDNTFTISASNLASSTASSFINGGNAQIVYYTGLTGAPLPTGYGGGGYGLGGYGVGVTASGNRTFTISSLTRAAGIVTANLSGSIYTIPVGTVLNVSGVTPSTYDLVNAVVTSSSPGVFSYALAGSTAPGTGGDVTITSWAFSPVTDWTLDNWGEDLIACPHMGSIFYWAPTTATSPPAAVVVPNAPPVNEGAFVAMPARQIVAYGSTFTGIQDPMLVRWTDLGNFTKWVGTVTNQAGSYRIPTGSKIIGAMQGPQQGLLWTDIGLWSMQYINLPNVYSFNEIASGCGLVGRKAAASMSGVVYWLSQSQFFRLSGGGVETIPCPIWDVIFQDIDFSHAENIRCAPNSRFGEIAWFYPVLNADGTPGTGQPTKYVKYNILMNAWDFGTLSRTAWIDQSVLGAPIAAGINGSGYPVFQHEVGNDANGEAMPSYIQTGYFALNEGDMKSFVDQLWPNMKWGLYGSSNQNAQVKITFFVADYPDQTPEVYGPFTVNQASTFISPRFRGRLVSIRIASDDVGSFWRLGNIRYRIQPDGKY